MSSFFLFSFYVLMWFGFQNYMGANRIMFKEKTCRHMQWSLFSPDALASIEPQARV